MKFLLAMTLAVSGAAFAGGQHKEEQQAVESSSSGQPFAAKKQEKLDKLDKKVSSLSAYRACISDAQNENALKSCKMSEDVEIQAEEDVSSEPIDSSSSDPSLEKQESSGSSSSESTESSY